jgi:hypothetical protein
MAAAVALSGRRIDAPGAKAAFPLHRRDAVAAALRTQLADASARLLVCSAACGADLLALDAAGALGIRRRIVLPFARAVFRRRSVTDRPGDWGPLFDRICDEVERDGDLVVLDKDPDEEACYLETAHAILSEAEALMGETGCRERLALIVWEGPRRDGADVTRDFLEEARRRGWAVAEVGT